MKQSARVEAFKTRQSAAHALHLKFHLTTGEPVLTDDQYHHLQIDAVSLYLLFLVQMITSGLQIIYTQVNIIAENVDIFTFQDLSRLSSLASYAIFPCFRYLLLFWFFIVLLFWQLIFLPLCSYLYTLTPNCVLSVMVIFLVL